jgi:hypothetical protein
MREKKSTHTSQIIEETFLRRVSEKEKIGEFIFARQREK